MREAMSASEAQAQRTYDHTVHTLRSELAEAVRDPRSKTDGLPPPCPECPRKQAHISKLEVEVNDLRRGKGDAERKLQDLYDDSAAVASAQHF